MDELRRSDYKVMLKREEFKVGKQFDTTFTDADCWYRFKPACKLEDNGKTVKIVNWDGSYHMVRTKEKIPNEGKAVYVDFEKVEGDILGAVGVGILWGKLEEVEHVREKKTAVVGRLGV